MSDSGSQENCPGDDQNPGQQEAMDREMITTFASVFVKVEVESDDQYESDDDGKANETAPHSEQIVPDLGVSCPQPDKKPNKRIKKSPTLLHCEHCEYTTFYKNCLQIHILRHSSEKPYVCNQCSYSTKYQSALTRHHQFRHNDNFVASFNCTECTYKTNFKHNLYAHRRKHCESKTFQCTQCNFRTSYKHSYNKHCRVHQGDMVFKCDKCPFQTKHEGHITRHLAKLHNEICETGFKCDYCDFVSKYNWRLTIHKQRMKRDQPLHCAVRACYFKTFYNCELKRHKFIAHTGENKIPKYIMRLGTTQENFALQLGSQVNEQEAPKQTCSVESVENDTKPAKKIENSPETSHTNSGQTGSGKQKSSETTQVNYYVIDPIGIDWKSIEVHESTDSERPFKCVDCAFTAKYKASVQRHFQRFHTRDDEKPYRCTNCDFRTKTKDQIVLHNKRSLNEVPMICSICNFTTFFRCTSNMHQRSHYENKCSLCNYVCRQAAELQRHIAAHHLGEGEKCRYCDYRNSRKENVRCHEMIHTGQKPFKCQYCSYSSIRHRLLDKHLRRNHAAIRAQESVVISEEKINSLKIPVSEIKSGSFMGS